MNGFPAHRTRKNSIKGFFISREDQIQIWKNNDTMNCNEGKKLGLGLSLSVLVSTPEVSAIRNHVIHGPVHILTFDEFLGDSLLC